MICARCVLACFSFLVRSIITTGVLQQKHCGFDRVSKNDVQLGHTLQRSIDRCHLKPCVFGLVERICVMVVPRSAVFLLNLQRGRFPARNDVVMLLANINTLRLQIGVFDQFCKAPSQVLRLVLEAEQLLIFVVVAQAATASRLKWWPSHTSYQGMGRMGKLK